MRKFIRTFSEDENQGTFKVDNWRVCMKVYGLIPSELIQDLD